MKLIKRPVLCNYYVTYRCNASCSFCDIWERPSSYASIDTVYKNLGDLRKLGIKVIDFTGGEPLLHRQIDELLAMARKAGLITTLTTNALLYPKWAERLRGLVNMLHFSLDSSDRERHDRSRGIACYDKLIESIKIARSIGERPDILFTTGKDTVDELEEVYNSICLPNNLVLIINPLFEYNAKGTLNKLDEEAIRTLKTKWVGRKNVYLNRAFLDLRLEGGNNIYDPVCKAASSTIVISPENKLILPCYHLGKQEIPIEDNLYALYTSPKVKDLVALEGRLPECAGCVINCYMQPSFAVNMNRFWFKAFPSTIKYNIMKGTWRHLRF